MNHPDDPSAYLRVAAAQLESAPGDLAGNAAAAAEQVNRADHAGADLVVFGELFLPGYHPPTLRSRPALCDLDVDFHGRIADPRLDPLRDMAQRHRIPVLIGASVRRGPRRYIATLLVDSLGGVRDVYHKQHLCDAHERELFAPGEHGTTLVVNGWRLGLGICYDACFPEHARAAAQSGCHAYLTGAAFVTGGEHRSRLYHAARALDNTFYVVFANAVDGPQPWTFCGGSAIFDPQGRPLDTAGTSGPGLAVADLEAAVLEQTRMEHTMLADVRADLAERTVVEVGR